MAYTYSYIYYDMYERRQKQKPVNEYKKIEKDIYLTFSLMHSYILKSDAHLA